MVNVMDMVRWATLIVRLGCDLLDKVIPISLGEDAIT